VILAPGPDRLYVRHAAAAELGAWSVERDIRWDAIDPDRARSRPDLLARLRQAAIAESCHPVAIARLLRLATDDVDAGALLSLELYDGFKHFHALRTYLEVVEHDPAITDDDILSARRRSENDASDDAAPGKLTAQLVSFMLSEHLASYFFRRLGEQAPEPVLAELLLLIAADEARHAQGTSDLLAKQIVRDRSLIASVLDASARFRLFADEVGGLASVPHPGDVVAIKTLAVRIEQLCGVRLVDHLKASL
jgi:hypothetical protein